MDDHTDDFEWVALLKSVADSPADDLPRLIAADWLEERGESDRAEFIRLGCSLAATPPGADGRGPGDPRAERESELFRELIAKHLGWFVPHGFDIREYFVTDRGFLSEIRCPLALWVGGGPCSRCTGIGMSPRTGARTAADSKWESCSRCRGIGRVSGQGPRWIRQHPIAAIAIADREPWSAGLEACESHIWSLEPRGSQTSELHELPEAIFSHLRGGRSTAAGVRQYPTAALARDALSSACLEWASGATFEWPHTAVSQVRKQRERSVERSRS